MRVEGINRGTKLNSGAVIAAPSLLDEVARSGSDKLQIAHDEIAHHLGSAREIVSRMLKRFADDGYVALSRGTIILLGKQGLHALLSTEVR